MSRTSSFSALLAAFALTALACTAGSSSGEPTINGSADAPRQKTITAPTSGLVVTATVSAVTLGDECATAAAGKGVAAGTCAPSDSGADAASGCGGPSYCQPSNVQLAFTAAAGTKSAKIEVLDVTLLDQASAQILDVLTASHPQVWSGNAYAPWDELVTPSSDMKTSYDLSAPAWSTLNAKSPTSTYSTTYKIYVTLRIDGVKLTLQLVDLSREPAVAT
jgi:hypothetical protein